MRDWTSNEGREFVRELAVNHNEQVASQHPRMDKLTVTCLAPKTEEWCVVCAADSSLTNLGEPLRFP